MKKTEQQPQVTLDGESYPCKPLIGANFDFKDITGKEATAINQDSITEMVTYMWCCARSSCRRLCIDFPYTLQQFADALEAEDIEQWGIAITQSQENKKKQKGTHRPLTKS